MEDLENLVAHKDTELSEKDEIEELKRQLEEAKKYKPTDDRVVPVYSAYPPGYPVHGYPYYPPIPYYIPQPDPSSPLPPPVVDAKTQFVKEETGRFSS